jgi:hypothetical protein
MLTTLKMLTVRTVGVFCVAMVGAGCTAVDEPAPRAVSPAPPATPTPPAPPPVAAKPTTTKPPSVAKPAVPPPAVLPPVAKAPAAAVKPADPPLDLAALKTRLRETPAIGVLTKLSLQNQVEDLLGRFRAHYQSGRTAEVASLRQPYDMLVLKVLALVQDTDPALARTIAGSRETLWGILADPQKFNSATI